MVQRKQPGVERRAVSNQYTLEEADRNKAIGRLSQPDAKYTKTEAGVAEYKKAGLSYPDNNNDKHYQDFLERTPAGPGNPFSQKNKTRVLAISRVRLTPDKEFLTWSQTETRWSPLDNPEQKTRQLLGIYPIIEYKNVQKEDDTGYRHIDLEPTGYRKTGYYMPYTLDNIDKLHKDASDDYEYNEITGEEIRPTRYIVKDMRKHMSVSVKDWESSRDGDFDELYQFGTKIISQDQQQAITADITKQKQLEEAKKFEKVMRSA